MRSQRIDVPDLTDEDAALLARWIAGPGARPTKADSKRWRAAVRDGVIPRRKAGAA